MRAVEGRPAPTSARGAGTGAAPEPA